jgi:hypothetical protein
VGLFRLVLPTLCVWSEIFELTGLCAVLSHLTCKSLEEDRYGVVQRDIPKILEAMLSFLSAVEQYQIEINALHAIPPPDQLAQLSPTELASVEASRIEVEKASDALGVLSGGTSGSLLFLLPVSLAFNDRRG